ncbi:MAG: hypothetical protein IJ011_03735 [Clostridia bacterium]|nr:hypothetical protein [Clostridia bacterium]
MLFYKILGAALVAGSGVMLSLYLNRRASAALQRAEAWAALIGKIKSEVECFSLPISAILSRVDGDLLISCGYAAQRAPRTLSELIGKMRWADRETERIARGFISDFGQSYRAEQVGRCAYYLSLMEGRKEELRSELPSKRRLNSTLCLAGSLGLLILFM